MVVVAYGLIIPEDFLNLPRAGCWNIHASLLPRWRGAAPIQRAIEAGDEETGVCIMQMDATLDTGPVYRCAATPIGLTETAGELHDRLSSLGAQALMECLSLLAQDSLPPPVEQAHTDAVYAKKLSKPGAEIDWNLSAVQLDQQIRAFNPWPVSWCEYNGQRLRIWRAEVAGPESDSAVGRFFSSQDRQLYVNTASGLLKIKEIQRAGGKKMAADEFLKSHTDWFEQNV